MFTALVVDCEYNFTNRTSECRLYDYWKRGDTGRGEDRKVWFTLGSAAYTSTGKDSDNGQYGWFENHMLVVEPMVERRASNRWQYGAGLTYNFVFGERFRRFHNLGFKVQPVVHTFPTGLVVALTGRLYPREYTPEDFGVQPKQANGDRKMELALSLTFGWRRPPISTP